MATAIDVLVPPGPDAKGHADAVFDLFRGVETSMNEWREGSPIAEINRLAGGKPVAAPGAVRRILHRGMEIGARTHGAFDVTWAALWGLWDFSARAKPHVPDPAEVAARLRLIDYRKVEIDDRAGTVRLPVAGMKLGLGGIAKGWALDEAAKLLRSRGVRNFSVTAGGQVYVGGQHGDRPWRVGIRNPRGSGDDILAVFDAHDASASTSGDYEHFFNVDGVLYHHILDPSTGMPARGLRSVTVLAADATLADALSTALMVLGRAKSLALLEKFPGVECVLIDDHGEMWSSPGLQGKVHRLRP